MTNRSRHLLLAGAAALAFTGPGLALAQSTTVESVEVSTAPVKGYVVKGALTVSKTDTPLIELPRSVTVVTADEMANRAVSDVGQIFAYSAGVNSDNYGGGPLSRVYSNVRGFFGMHYLDGLRLTDFNYGIETYGLERAELIKGPPSALFGQTNPGGLLNMVSKRPTTTPMREMQVQVGSYNRVQGAIDFSGPITSSGSLSMRLVALARDADTIYGGATKDSRYYVAPSLTWKPGTRTDVTLLAAYQHDPKLINFQFLPRAGTVDATAFGRISRQTYGGDHSFDNSSKSQSQIALLTEHRFSDQLALRANARYLYIDIHQQFLQGGALAANQRTQSRTAVNADFIINVAQVDSSLNAKFSTGPLQHNLLVGADYSYVPSYQGQGTAAGPTQDLYAPVYGLVVNRPAITSKRDQHQRQTGFYAQDQITLGDLSVLLGVRRDHATSTTRNKNAITGARTSFVAQSDDAWTGQAGAIYRLAGGFAPYVNWSRSFYPTPGTDFFGTPFVPATGEEFEGGVKWQPTQWKVFASAAVFDLKQNNVRTPDLLHPNFLVQIGQVRSRGGEFEVKASLSRLNLAASYTHLSNKVTRANNNTLGKIVPGRPNDQAALWADYQLIPALTLGGGVRFMGSSWGDTANTFKVDDYTLFDALIRVDFGALTDSLAGLDLSLNATNLGDRRYVANCDAATQCFYGQPRIVKATLRKRW